MTENKAQRAVSVFRLPSFIFSLLFLVFCLPSSVFCMAEPLWFSQDNEGAPQIHFYFFWSQHCPHCQVALPFVRALEEKYPWLVLRDYELSQEENVRRYVEMAALFKQEGNAVPGFMFCRQMTTGFDNAATTGKFLEKYLLACYQQVQQASVPAVEKSPEKLPQTTVEPPEVPEVIVPPLTLPFLGAVNLQRFSLPVYTLIIASVDAFNPCAFFVLLFLLSLLVHTRNRTRMLLVGGIFVFFSGLIYFLFMAAWLNVFLRAGELKIITAAAGMLAILIGGVNIKDFFWFKRGVSLAIPEQAKPLLYQRMRGLMQVDHLPTLLLGTILLAIAANTYELLCTAGFPMVYTRLLTLAELKTFHYYLYLLFYNIIYVIPLLIIVLAFTFTLGSRKLQEREGRFLKLLSGAMMLELGVVLLLAPQMLNNIGVALLILLTATGSAGFAAWWEKRQSTAT